MTGATTAVDTLWVNFLGAEVRYYDVKGARTRVVEAGSGAPVLLLHGLSGHAETWTRNVMPLAAHFHVYAVDMLGHGFTDKPDVRYTIPVLTQHIFDLLGTLRIERASIIGQSLGGWVGCWAGLEHPGRVDKLVLATGAGLQPDADAGSLQTVLGQVQQVTQTALETPTRESVRRRLEWLMRRPQTVTDELVEVRYRVFTDPGGQAILPRVVDDTMNGSDAYFLTADRLRRIQAPTYVFWTRHNPTVQWETAERAFKLIPKARWYLMEDAAHWPQFEKADEFNSLVTEFLLGGQ
jgi:2-hydroxy-6-oxo-6-(2'-carboxyphenyl)-hexa-2,4-dienoate hydrolase